jgi:membrane protease YdiL (CAAX protease family)
MLADDRKRLPLALLTFVAWVLATLFSMKWADDGTKKALVDTITHGISWNIAIAIAVLALATFIWRWNDLRFVWPDVGQSLRLAWFPLVYLALFLGMALFLGLPPLGIMLFVAINTALVGLSEEWMFRGVLYRGLRSRFAIWTAIILSCLLFGSVHVLNVFVTGEFGEAVLQAMTAAMSGLVFVALLIRTGSLWVPIVYHALWDFGTFTVSSGADKVAGDALSGGGLTYLLPMALVLPNFLYALYLLRNVRNERALAAA